MKRNTERRLERLEQATVGRNGGQQDPDAWPACNIHEKTPAEVEQHVNEVAAVLDELGLWATL